MESEINSLNVHFHETLRIKTEHFLVLITAELDRLQIEADAQIAAFIVTINHTTEVTIQGLKDDAAKLIAEFTLQIQVKTDLEIHQLTVWWTDHYAGEELRIIHHWTALIGDLEINGQKEIDDATIRITAWILEVVTKLNYDATIQIEKETADINVWIKLQIGILRDDGNKQIDGAKVQIDIYVENELRILQVNADAYILTIKVEIEGKTKITIDDLQRDHDLRISVFIDGLGQRWAIESVDHQHRWDLKLEEFIW